MLKPETIRKHKSKKLSGEIEPDLRLFAVLACVLAVIVLFLANCGIASAGELPKERVIMAAIGEDESGGLEGMRCVISAVFNRKTLRGVYGERSRRVKEHKYSPKTFVLAVQAYEDARKHDYVDGATHWEGASFKTPYWAAYMDEVKVCGGNRYYRERK
jgi:hypothetical protein